MNLAALLANSARHKPHATALAVGARPYCSYAELSARARCLGGALRGPLGLAPGDRVALAMTNCPQFFETLFAIWHAGLIAVPINAKLHQRELQFVLDHSGSRVCFCTAELYEPIRALETECAQLDAVIAVGTEQYCRLINTAPTPQAQVESDAPAWLFYTSGTTGKPKGATLTHGNLQFMVLAYYADIDRLDERDTIVHAAPLSHGSGLYGLAHIACAGRNVIVESGHFDASEIFSLLRQHENVSMFAAPTMVARMLRASESEPPSARNLKTLIYGGGPMYFADLQAAIDLFGARLFNLYGQGESPMTITGLPQRCHADRLHPRYGDRLQSCGIARTAVEVRVVDEEDRDVPCGALGEVLTRSDCVMSGYWGAPEASAAALKGGWLHTGDLGSLDGDGFLTLKDRSKDMIISGGSNVYPREVEEVLLRHVGVVEAAVVGRAHAQWGEEVVAFVVRDPRCCVHQVDLDTLCLQHIARFKRPRAYFFVEQLPKNNYGKVLKTELRRMLMLPAEQAGAHGSSLDEDRSPE